MAEITRDEITAICEAFISQALSCAIPEPWEVARKFGADAAEAILARLGDGWKPVDDKARNGGLVDLWGHEDIMPPLSALRRIPDCRWERWGPTPGDGWYGWKSPSGREVRTAKYYMAHPSSPKESA